MLFKMQRSTSLIYILETNPFDHLKCYLSLGAIGSEKNDSPIFLLILYFNWKIVTFLKVSIKFSLILRFLSWEEFHQSKIQEN